MYYGKDEKYNQILKKLSERIGENKDKDLAAILSALIDLLIYLDDKEDKKNQITFD